MVTLRDIKQKYSNEFSLFSHGLNYLSGNVFLKSLGFITLPILTRFLTVEEFGLISLYRITISILIILFSLSINTSISRYYYEKMPDFNSFLGSHIIGITVYISIVASVMIAFGSSLASIIGISISIFHIAVTISIFTVYVIIYQELNLAKKLSARYSLFQVIQQSSIIIFSVIMIIQMPEDKYLGRIYGDYLIIPFVIFAAYKLFKDSEFKFKKRYFYYTAKIAFPSVPGMLSGIALVQIDRLFIQHYYGYAETGLYSYVYQLGMIVSIVSSSLLSSWTPQFYDLMADGSIQALNKMAIRMLWFISVVASSIILFSPEISALLAPESFQGGIVLVPIIVISYLISDQSAFYAKYILFDKRYIAYTPLAVIISGVINILLNYLLIPKYGYRIAAITTLISYLSMFAFYYYIAHKAMSKEILRLRYILKPLLLVIAATICFYAIHAYSGPYLNQIIVKLGVIAILISAILIKRKEISTRL